MQLLSPLPWKDLKRKFGYSYRLPTFREVPNHYIIYWLEFLLAYFFLAPKSPPGMMWALPNYYHCWQGYSHPVNHGKHCFPLRLLDRGTCPTRVTSWWDHGLPAHNNDSRRRLVCVFRTGHHPPPDESRPAVILYHYPSGQSRPI